MPIEARIPPDAEVSADDVLAEMRAANERAAALLKSLEQAITSDVSQ
jgi:hypothetical protein